MTQATQNTKTSKKIITKEEVEHIAKLSKLKLTETEVGTYTGQLGQILNFFTQLQEVNTDGVPETSQVTGLTNIMRKDQVTHCHIEKSLIQCTPNQIENNSIKIPKIM